MPSRRGFLAAAAGGALSGCGISLEQGLWNPCRSQLPQRLASHALVQAAWQGIDARQMWDAHAHLLGTGDSGSGIVIHSAMQSLLSPAQFARRLFFLNAGCVHEAPGNVDRSYLERIHNLVDGLRPGVKLLLFAFDRAYREDGRPDPESALYVPDRYARDVARAHPDYFEWAASIHPYRADCVEALEWAAANGARAVKWLPAAMGMDPASPRCERFYAALARLSLPLICHAGEERAVLGRDAQAFGNPLRLRRALSQGVRVVVAHCASMGQDRDLDRGPEGPVAESFELFARMMDEPRYAGLLFGDIAAMTQKNRAVPALARVIGREDWHPRLLNGSDYPLPGVMPIFSVDELVSIGLLQAAAAPVLKEIRSYNVLLFDFVLKRTLRSGGKAFAPRVFETRGFFERLKG
ncbi:MAG: amidohydrolase [Betaproteobacteria bacterium RIFCSPLOWO2_02_FULL_66_14]|nr:MAG: amidohydrolase [Betaproteobacteria bacterium RIFCSPLOWO2_02_FULL_66_14]